MKDEGFDLSPDLEWMLSSTQAAPEEVQEAVAQEFGPALYRLALDLLNDAAGAQAAVQHMIERLPAARQRYSSALGPRAWLYGQVVEICQQRRRAGLSLSSFNLVELTGERRASDAQHQLWAAVDRLPERQRTPLLLSLSQRLPAGEIARILRLPEARVKSSLRQARRQFHRRLWRVGRDRPRLFQLGQHHRRARDLAQAKLAGESLGVQGLTALEAHLQACPACRAYQLELIELEALLTGGLGARAAYFETYTLEPGALLAQTDAGLARRRNERRRWAPLRQAALAAGALALVLAFGWLTNRLFPRSAATLTQSAPATRLVQVPVSITRVVTPASPPPLAALGLASSEAEVRHRMAESARFWRSLWADGLLLNYGPAGYIGPPQVYRNQIWLEQPEKQMVISGLPDTSGYVTFRLYKYLYEMDLQNRLTYYYRADEQASQRLYGPARAFSDPDGTDLRWYVDGSPVQRLVYPQPLALQARSIQVVGMEPAASIELLVVDAWVDAAERARAGESGLRPAVGKVDVEPGRYRLWLDPQTGLALRWQRFDPLDPSTVVTEVILNQLVLGASFPEQAYSAYFFSPERFTWANEWQPDPADPSTRRIAWAPAPGRSISEEASQRASGEPVLIPPNAPWPERLGLDSLSFRWDFHWDRFREGEDVYANRIPDRVANLFAGGYFLGRVELGNPWYLVCERSPDGLRIAFNEGWNDPFMGTLDARWLDLRSPEDPRLLLTEGSLVGSDVAFSPDSRSLAFWGCGGSESNCGIYIQDLGTGKNRKLAAMPNSAFFTWSPDGQSLAMIRLPRESEQASRNPFVAVLDANTGRVLYDGEFDWLAQETPVDAPTRAWGIVFPPARTGLAGCIAPP